MDVSETIAASDLKGSRSIHLIEFMKVSIEGQGHFFTIYFPGWRILKPPSSLLATDRSKAVVIGVVPTKCFWSRCFVS